MDDGSRPSLIITVVLLALAILFAITETALSSVSRNRIKAAVERGDTRARKALKALDQFDRAITTLLICTNIVHISMASVVTVYVTRRWGLSAVTLGTIITTITVFFIGEMVPKSIAKKNSESCILATAGLLLFLMKLLSPLSSVLARIGSIASNATRSEPEITVTEDELYDIIEDLEEEGSIDEEQSDLFSSTLQYKDETAVNIITPVARMISIDISDDPDNILALVRETNHSRLPVYSKSPDSIIGILPIRKFLKSYISTGNMPDIRDMLDRPFFTSKDTPIHQLIEEMSKNQASVAIVRDDSGAVLGIVTIEDILEELVGEIWDESDVVPESSEDSGYSAASASSGLTSYDPERKGGDEQW